MADLTKTRADLVRQVLDNLGKLGNDEPSAEDSDKVDRVIDPTVSQLSALGIYTFGDVGSVGPTDGAIEPEGFLPLAHIVANAAAPSFNMAGDTTLIGLAKLAQNDLEIIAAPPRTLRTLRIDRALQTRRRAGYYNGTI